MDLWSTYVSLPQPSSAAAYTIGAGPGVVRIARSYDNFPALVIATRGEGLAPRRLANLRFMPPVEMLVARADGSSESSRFAVLECTAADSELERYFCRAVGSFFAGGMVASATTPTSEELERALDAITKLFQLLGRPAGKSVQGLWAELAMIAWASSPEAAISAWHSKTTDLHDFALGPHRLEVKSTQSMLREHHFRLDQLSAATAGATIIASLMLQPSSNGMGVFDLAEQICGAVGKEAAARLETLVAQSLGCRWRDTDDGAMRFELKAARQTLRLYHAEDVPRVALPLPPGIKRVEFVADLSQSTEQPLEQARALAPLYAQLLPALVIVVSL